VNTERYGQWSSPDADGISTCNLDVGAVSTLRGRRRRKAVARNIDHLDLWPEAWRELIGKWLKQGRPRRKWEGLLKLAGGRRVNDAWQVLESLLKAGLVQIEERREGNRWQPLWVQFVDLESIREAVGLPNRDKLQRRAEKNQEFVLKNSALEELQASLDGMPAELAVRRHELLEALDRWISEERSGTRRDFSYSALGDTKRISPADWNWLELFITLEDIGIFRHTPAIWLRAPFLLISDKGNLDLRGVPDCIGLTPGTIKRLNRIEGDVAKWCVVENRTVFERLARRKGSADCVIWTPGFAPDWWKKSVIRMLQLRPAPALIACDPDPSGIEIALQVGRIWMETTLDWEPWRMDVRTLSGLRRKKDLTDNDKERLKHLLLQTMPQTLKELCLWMLENGQKGEQEGIVF